MGGQVGPPQVAGHRGRSHCNREGAQRHNMHGVWGSGVRCQLVRLTRNQAWPVGNNNWQWGTGVSTMGLQWALGNVQSMGQEWGQPGSGTVVGRSVGEPGGARQNNGHLVPEQWANQLSMGRFVWESIKITVG